MSFSVRGAETVGINCKHDFQFFLRITKLDFRFNYKIELEAQLVCPGNCHSLSSDWHLAGGVMPEVSVKDVNQQELVRALAAFLRKSRKLRVPEWVDTVKLARHTELAPYNENWFYIQAASTAHHLYLCCHAGVGSMTKVHRGQQRTVSGLATSTEAPKVQPAGCSKPQKD